MGFRCAGSRFHDKDRKTIMTMIRCISPVDGSVYAERPAASFDDAKAAIDRARKAQKAWAKRPLEERVSLVLKGVARLNEMAEDVPGQGNPQGQGFQPGQQVRRDKGGIGPAGAAAIGLGGGVVGGYILSNQLRGVSEVHQHRESYVDNGVTYVREPGRVIIREQGGRAFIRHDETERFAILGYKPQVVREGDFYRSFYDRPDGVRVITVTDADGNLIRRIRRYRDGREVIIIDNGFRPRPVRFVDHVIVVPPPVLTIPRERYIVDASESDEGTIYETLTAPPLSRLTRRYTLDEVRYSPDLRAQVRSVEVNSVTFDSGSWNVEQSQVSRLSVIAAAINKAIEANPEAVFLIEGHTDAVGDADDNLSLSDRRAQSVAEILTRDFGIPAENLTTQGYGETQLKVQTEGDARANRRVVIRNITSLIAASAEESQGGQAPQQ
jgi:outer membrane protein OmpA-like peptidoglycan-associated protein